MTPFGYYARKLFKDIFEPDGGKIIYFADDAATVIVGIQGKRLVYTKESYDIQTSWTCPDHATINIPRF